MQITLTRRQYKIIWKLIKKSIISLNTIKITVQTLTFSLNIIIQKLIQLISHPTHFSLKPIHFKKQSLPVLFLERCNSATSSRGYHPLDIRPSCSQRWLMTNAPQKTGSWISSRPIIYKCDFAMIRRCRGKTRRARTDRRDVTQGLRVKIQSLVVLLIPVHTALLCLGDPSCVIPWSIFIMEAKSSVIITDERDMSQSP